MISFSTFMPVNCPEKTKVKFNMNVGKKMMIIIDVHHLLILVKNFVNMKVIMEIVQILSVNALFLEENMKI